MDVCYRVRCKPAGWVLDVIEGRRRGPLVPLARAALAVAGGAYGVAVRLRNRAYDRGLLAARDVSVPVVSVGNLTAGGTGKTPMVAWLVSLLQRCGWRPAIVSRGYGNGGSVGRFRSSANRGVHGPSGSPPAHTGSPPGSASVNDEFLVLERLCPGVPHVQGADRVAAAEQAVRQFASDCVVADDAFQHRRLARDVDLVLIDATNPWGHGRLLPAGLLREPRRSLRRADVVAVTRAEAVSAGELERVRGEIGRWLRPGVPIVGVRFGIDGALAADGTALPLSELPRPVLAFCGIGNPRGFQSTLQRCGLSVARLCVFPDHWRYDADDVAWLLDQARACGAGGLLTTLKDMVKLGAWSSKPMPLFALRQVVAVDGAERLAEVVSARIERHRRAAFVPGTARAAQGGRATA